MNKITRLLAVVQKGIHAETYRAETRRCLLRTILLLDDRHRLRAASEFVSSPQGRRRAKNSPQDAPRGRSGWSEGRQDLPALSVSWAA